LTIIADYMTFEGGYKPFNRAGMNESTSPYQKMSFETTTGFLADATMYAPRLSFSISTPALLIAFSRACACRRGDWDPINNASASLVLGKVVEGGTGCFELLQPLILPQQQQQASTSQGDDAMSE
jgi:DNA-directed RNA polymerase I subunit RPA1